MRSPGDAPRRRCPPCTRSSFCLAKRNQKRRPGSSAPAFGWGSLRCSFRGAAGLNSLRSLRSLRSDSNPGSELEARCARAPLHCAARRLRTGQQLEQPNTEQPGPQPLAPFPGCWLLGCSPRLTSRAAQPSPARAQRASSTDAARLSDRSERSERREFRAGRAWRAAQGTPANGGGEGCRGARFSPLLARQKGVGCRGEAPAGSRQEHPPCS
jgi:hypothetical protein